MRVDRYIAERLALFTRSQGRSRLVGIRVNGREVKRSRRLKAGDLLEILYTDPPPLDLVPEAIPLDILYEDARVIVLNKPRGLVVHPGAGHFSGTLVNGLLHHAAGLRERFPGEPLRPGIVHRLDKDTSGVLIVAGNPEVQEFLARQFRDRTVKKQYLALVHGVPRPPEGTIRSRISRDPRDRKKFTGTAAAGKPAVTRYRVLRQGDGCALVSLRPRTGRTHQLRVHLLGIGCPIVGDPLYGRRSDAGLPLMLHAFRLAITLPGEDAPRVFRAPPPADFRRQVRACLAGPPAGRP